MMNVQPDEIEQHTLQITGMTCAACATRIEKGLQRLEGMQEVAVNYAMGRANVTFDRDKIRLQRIEDKVEQLGYGVLKPSISAAEHHQTEVRQLRIRLFISAVLTLPLFWTMWKHYSFTSGVWVPDLFLNPWFQLALATPVQFIIGMPFYVGAFRALRAKSANMDVLVALGTSSAYFYSHYLAINHLLAPPSMHSHHVHLYFETSSMIITVVLLGKLLEAMAKGRTMRALQHLQSLEVKTANVIRNNREFSVSLDDVLIGDRVIIRPGERVPVDGQVGSGSSLIDESMITGEHIPVEKNPGDQVISGSINKNGMLQVVAQKIGRHSTIARMMRLIEEAQQSKPPIQRIADDIADVFVPVILSIAAVTFLAWYFVFASGEFGPALERAITVLVIACPCAIGLATPISIMVGSGQAARKGILFKEGKFIELMHKTEVVVLDKTGTITMGKPELTDFIAIRQTKDELVRYAAAAEMYSEHPISKAILAEAARRRVVIPNAESFASMPGYGIRATVENKDVRVGTLDSLELQKIELKMDQQWVDRMEGEGKTVLYMAVDGKLAGMFAIRDQVKPSSRQAIGQLHRMGIEVLMVTGDHRATAESIADLVGIRHIHANVLPDGKVELVKRLQQEGKKVIMVGDGVNDAPALAAADIGIAMGKGTDMAVEAANVSLMRGDLIGIADAIRISRKTMRNIRQNLTLALVYNMVAIPFAVIGIMEPWIAGTAMALSSVSVVGNALRLQRSR